MFLFCGWRSDFFCASLCITLQKNEVSWKWSLRMSLVLLFLSYSHTLRTVKNHWSFRVLNGRAHSVLVYIGLRHGGLTDLFSTLYLDSHLLHINLYILSTSGKVFVQLFFTHLKLWHSGICSSWCIIEYCFVLTPQICIILDNQISMLQNITIWWFWCLPHFLLNFGIWADFVP